VKIDYTGMFVDGTVFDTSLKSKQGQPPKPMELFASGYAIVNGNRVGMIKAFGIVLPMMNVGSKWKVVIPPELAYQVRGQGPIGPNETLVFEIEMKEIVEQSAKE
jgi:FKBP-type peptidyl-prolyl cis-trans isomerase